MKGVILVALFGLGMSFLCLKVGNEQGYMEGYKQARAEFPSAIVIDHKYPKTLRIGEEAIVVFGCDGKPAVEMEAHKIARSKGYYVSLQKWKDCNTNESIVR